jgi:molybdopterin molybdotransferase
MLERADFPAARRLMLAQAEPLEAEDVPLEAAHGRLLAAMMFADDDLVPYARSAMDGYALHAADTGAARSPVVLPVRDASYAGDTPHCLARGCAMAIATGSPLPYGADAVVPVEDVRRLENAIEIHVPLQPGDHVFGSGDDAKRGDVLARYGDPVTPGRAGLLAAAGFASVRVYRRPRVAIVCTGDEVIGVHERPRAGQIRNSNATMLAGHLARDGADVVSCVSVADAPEPLAAALRSAFAASDLVITTGGASVGERDFVKRTCTGLGTRFAFRSVALRPAKPTAFGRCGSTLVAVLPGNPAAAFVAYAMLVRGVVRRLAGWNDAYPAPVGVQLDGVVHAKPERHFVMFARLRGVRGELHALPLDNQCSSLVRTSADANALIIVPPGDRTLRPGDVVEVEVLDWSAVDMTAS